MRTFTSFFNSFTHKQAQFWSVDVPTTSPLSKSNAHEHCEKWMATETCEINTKSHYICKHRICGSFWHCIHVTVHTIKTADVPQRIPNIEIHCVLYIKPIFIDFYSVLSRHLNSLLVDFVVRCATYSKQFLAIRLADKSNNIKSDLQFVSNSNFLICQLHISIGKFKKMKWIF